MNKFQNNRQLHILQFIYDYSIANGYSPSVREIATAVELSSSSTVHGHLKRLEHKNLLSRVPDKPRTLEVTRSGLDALGVSTQHKQIPILADQHYLTDLADFSKTITDYFPRPNSLMNNSSTLFMLRNPDDAMTNVGIRQNDQLIIQRQQDAENGQIILILNDTGQLTLRRFFREADHFRLQPENNHLKPLIVKEVHIFGRVIGLYRDSF